MTTELKPCPFCGKDVQADVDSREVLHQSGIFWVDDKDSGRIYLGKSEMEAGTHFDGLCWEVHCPTIYGGCGAEISGDSRQEAINAWNKRSDASTTITVQAHPKMRAQTFEARDLLGRVMRRLKGSPRKWPRWVVVCDSFDVTTTVALGLCREFNLNPEELV